MLSAAAYISSDVSSIFLVDTNALFTLAGVSHQQAPHRWTNCQVNRLVKNPQNAK